MGRVISIFALVATISVGASLSSCSEAFEPFNLVDKVRILAIQAEPPTVMVGESTALRVLSYSPDDVELEYAWDWCPARLGSAGGYDCAVSEEDFEDLFAQLSPAPSVPIPPFDLGSDPEAAFSHFIDPLFLEMLCNDEVIGALPGFAAPGCDGFFPISVRLTLTGSTPTGETETVQAIKEVRLALGKDWIPNTNPVLDGISVRPAGSDGDFEELIVGANDRFLSGTSYDLLARFDEDIAETFVPPQSQAEPDPEPKRERLFLTWFVTAGETDAGRTGFIDGISSFEDLANNSYKTPREAMTATLFLVIQDERGGVGFVERRIEIVEI